jgi:hypothetical protein
MGGMDCTLEKKLGDREAGIGPACSPQRHGRDSMQILQRPHGKPCHVKPEYMAGSSLWPAVSTHPSPKCRCWRSGHETITRCRSGVGKKRGASGWSLAVRPGVHGHGFTEWCCFQLHRAVSCTLAVLGRRDRRRDSRPISIHAPETHAAAVIRKQHRPRMPGKYKKVEARSPPVAGYHVHRSATEAATVVPKLQRGHVSGA